MADFVPVDHNPFEGDEAAMQPETFVPPMLVDWAKQAAPKDVETLKKAGQGVADLATLPKRAIENSQFSVGTGTYDPRVPIEAALTAMTGGAAGTGEAATGEVLGSGPARMRMIEQADLSKELANQARAKGFATGKSAAGWDTPRPDAAKGSWADLVARTKAKWEGDKERALDSFHADVPGAPPRSALMTDEDYAVAGDPSFSRATFGSGATDKKTAAQIAAIQGLPGAETAEAAAAKSTKPISEMTDEELAAWRAQNAADDAERARTFQTRRAAADTPASRRAQELIDKQNAADDVRMRLEDERQQLLIDAIRGQGG